MSSSRLSSDSESELLAETRERRERREEGAREVRMAVLRGVWGLEDCIGFDFLGVLGEARGIEPNSLIERGEGTGSSG